MTIPMMGACFVLITFSKCNQVDKLIRNKNQYEVMNRGYSEVELGGGMDIDWRTSKKLESWGAFVLCYLFKVAKPQHTKRMSSIQRQKSRAA